MQSPQFSQPRRPFSRVASLALVALLSLIASACGDNIGGVDPLPANALIATGGGVPAGTGEALRLPAIEPDPNAPNHFFVSPNGSDDNDGKTPESAWQTIGQAIEVQTAGDVFWVMDGVYNEVDGLEQRGAAHFVLEVPGTDSSWIRYKAMPGHRPVIEAGVTSAFEITADYIEVQGFEMRGVGFTAENSFGYGVVVARSHHVVIADNEIHGFPTGGFGTRGSSHLYVMNNVVHDNALWDSNQGSGISYWRLEDHGFDDDAAGYSNYIVGNTLYGNENRVFCGFCGEDIITDGNGIIIDQNTMNEAGDMVDYSGRTLIANNVAFNNGGRAINIFQSINVDVFNNTTYQNLFTEGLEGENAEIATFDTRNIRIANNLITPSEGNKAIATRGEDQARQSNVIVGDKSGTSGNDILVTTAGFVNPSLDPAIADFRLRISSPAIDAAIPLQSNDADGRPRGALPDAGAYEASTGEGSIESSPSSTVAEKQEPDQ